MEPITRRALGERLGISPQRVSELIKPGQPLHPAVEGKHIDGRHPCIAEFAKTYKPRKRKAAKPKPKPKTTVESEALDDDLLHIEPGEVPEKLQRFQHLTILQIVNRYGTLAQFEYFLKAAKTIEEVQERRLKNAERESELIPREFVERYLFGYVEGITQRLLNDAPKTIAHRVAAAVKAKEPLSEIEKMVLRLISQDLRGAKDQLKRRIKNVK